uniref:Uncharacterized protein n=1 Tax=Sphaerodactylus townsendi TaxID=933632 RepID=A0ACB8EJK1_9SAUR
MDKSHPEKLGLQDDPVEGPLSRICPKLPEVPAMEQKVLRERKLYLISEFFLTDTEETASVDSAPATLDREKGDESAEEEDTADDSARIIQGEHFPRLLKKVTATLNYNTEEEQSAASSIPNITIGGKSFQAAN